MRQSLLDQGYLDEKFINLEQLQDDSRPHFVEKMAAFFCRDSTRVVGIIEKALEKIPVDFNELNGYMHYFKGTSSCIGAKKVIAKITELKEYCGEENAEGCLRTFQELKEEYTALKQKLQAYFQLLRQVGPKEIACRPL
ncbi:hypothetical protein Ddye_014504 [Dipteronia dyeriana]|uniref:Histidine-containing phosphotransfer protein n=1 Tax=Dipteronia dyeriana TaxID=168575 RepID=A0AAD9X8H6_9ROSI|nr:hypothetical protein Ddye_014504 [Dipteronia dyeriana]